METFESVNHPAWDCKYHVVFIPTCRRKAPQDELRRQLGDAFRPLATQKDSRSEGGHLLVDDLHGMIVIPPQYAVSRLSAL